MRATIAVLLLSTVTVAVTCTLAGEMGLTASIFPVSAPLGSPAAHTTFDRVPSADSVDRVMSFAPGQPARIAWDGFIFSSVTREYEFAVTANGPVKLEIDGAVVLGDALAGGTSLATVKLGRGQHLFSLEYEYQGGDQQLELQWDVGSPYRREVLPASVFSPRPLKNWRWTMREFASLGAAGVATAWSAVVIWIAWCGLRRTLPLPRLESSPELRVVLVGFALVFGAGIWWGWPAAWAPDELDPAAVLDFGRRFGDGWFDRYPPFHYWVLTIVYAPVHLADRLGWLHLDSEAIRSLLFINGRLLTVGMSLAILIGIAILATRTLGRTYAWPAAVSAGAFLPFVFYAKTVNLDVPYFFWFVISLVFLAEIHGYRRWRDYIGFGLTAAAAVCSKDQAYGLYVLPALHLLWRSLRSRHDLIRLAVGGAAGVLMILIVHNVVFDYDAFRAHVQLITGPASADYRMFPRTPAGQWALMKATAGQLLWTVGWPGALLLMAGCLRLWWRADRGTKVPRYDNHGYDSHGKALPAWIFLPVLSYALTFLAVVGYVYDRFLLPVIPALALVAAIGFRHILRIRARWPLAPVAASLLVGWMVWRAASIDLLLIRDSRYHAEAWLQTQAVRDDVVATVDEFGYLPRLDVFLHKRISPTISDTMAVRPEFIVINREFLLRFPEDSATREWLAWLERNEKYEEVYRYKAPLRWSAFAWSTRFTDRREDDFTNLDKANPEIVIFRRKT